MSVAARTWTVLLPLLVAAAAGCLTPGDGPPDDGDRLALHDFTDCDGPLPGGQPGFCEGETTPVDSDRDLPSDWYCVHRFELSDNRAMEVYRSPSGDRFGLWWEIGVEGRYSGLAWRDSGGTRSLFNWTDGNPTDSVRIPAPLEDGDKVGLMVYRAIYETNTSELQEGRLDQLWQWDDGFEVVHRLRTDSGTYYFPSPGLKGYHLDGRDFDIAIRFPKYIDVATGSESLATPEAGCHRQEM